MKNEEAQLIFLNSIEENTVKTAEAVGLLIDKHENLIKEIGEQTKQLLPKPFPEIKATTVNLDPVVNATLSVANQILQSSNKSDAAILRQVENLIELNRAIIAQLERLNRPKEWKFEIDRNFSTGKIQDVIAKQIGD